MLKKITIAGALGGVALFVWSTILHLGLPIGEWGIKSLPHEQGIVALLRDSVREHAFYLFPGIAEESAALPAAEREAAMRVWEERYRQGPTGLLVYNPAGRDPVGVQFLVLELLADIVAAVLAAWVLSRAGPALGVVSGLAAGGALGILGWALVDVSYWNWYAFPGGVLASSFVDLVPGMALAGAVIGWRLRSRPPAPQPPS